MSDAAVLHRFFTDQLGVWPEAKARYDALDNVCTRTVMVDGYPVLLQHNPARAVSTAAKVDSESIRQRKCFLCPDARPSQQTSLSLVDGYDVLVNPFPIFPEHFTIVSHKHEPQSGVDLNVAAELAMRLPGYAVFFNGAKSGASAPDHLHLQAGNEDFLPLTRYSELNPGQVIAADGPTTVYAMDELPMSALHIVTPVLSDYALRWLDMLLPDNADGLPDRDMRNIVFRRGADDNLHILFFPRLAHRPSCYYDKERMLMVSPGAVDMCGVLILPRKDDFDSIERSDIRGIYDEVSYRYCESERFKTLLLS